MLDHDAKKTKSDPKKIRCWPKWFFFSGCFHAQGTIYKGSPQYPPTGHQKSCRRSLCAPWAVEQRMLGGTSLLLPRQQGFISTVCTSKRPRRPGNAGHCPRLLAGWSLRRTHSKRGKLSRGKVSQRVLGRDARSCNCLGRGDHSCWNLPSRP